MILRETTHVARQDGSRFLSEADPDPAPPSPPRLAREDDTLLLRQDGAAFTKE